NWRSRKASRSATQASTTPTVSFACDVARRILGQEVLFIVCRCGTAPSGPEGDFAGLRTDDALPSLEGWAEDYRPSDSLVVDHDLESWSQAANDRCALLELLVEYARDAAHADLRRERTNRLTGEWSCSDETGRGRVATSGGDGQPGGWLA